MTQKLIAIIVLLSLSVNSRAQTNPETTLKSFFVTIQHTDSLKFISYFLSSGQMLEIVKAAESENLNTDSINLDSLNFKDGLNNHFYHDYLIKKNYRTLKFKADSLKINLSSLTYLNCKYQIIKDPQIFFTSLSGLIFFSDNQKTYKLKIEEAVLINDKWKITKLGQLSVLDDTTDLLKKPTKLSAFNSLNFQRQIVSDTVIEYIQEPVIKKRKKN